MKVGLTIGACVLLLYACNANGPNGRNVDDRRGKLSTSALSKRAQMLRNQQLANAVNLLGSPVQVKTLCSNKGVKNAGSSIRQASSLAFKFYNMNGAAPITVQTEPGSLSLLKNEILNRRNLTVDTTSLGDGSYYVAVCDGAMASQCTIDQKFLERFNDDFKNLKKNSPGLIGAIAELNVASGQVSSYKNAAVLLHAADEESFSNLMLGAPKTLPTGTDGSGSGGNAPTGTDGSGSKGNVPGADGSSPGGKDLPPADGSGSSNDDADGIDCDKVSSPLVIDLADQGITLSAPTDGVLFDIDGDGNKELISWPEDRSSVFLALDRNHNGNIDDVHELFGNGTVGPDGESAANGFAALQKYDDNNDHFIDEHDRIYSQLVLWSDVNRNGRVDAHELSSLSAHHIVWIDTSYIDMNEVDAYGNKTLQRSLVNIGGQLRKIFDVWFRPI